MPGQRSTLSGDAMLSAGWPASWLHKVASMQQLFSSCMHMHTASSGHGLGVLEPAHLLWFVCCESVGCPGHRRTRGSSLHQRHRVSFAPRPAAATIRPGSWQASC